MNKRRVALLTMLALAVAAFFLLDAGRFLSLGVLKQSQATLASIYAQRPWTVLAGFFAVYVAVATLSIPGAAVMTLAGGALFGLGPGLVLASFASSLGALLAFLSARFFLQAMVRRRFGQRLQEIDRGVQRDGAMFLFTLRLVPLVPFFVINVGMGLTGMRAWTFYWVSQLGMLAGTLVYVNAGTQLGQLQSVRGVLGPGLVASFALLAVFPWLARAGFRAVQRRRVFHRWKGCRPRRFDRNLVVIGAGAAGLVSAYLAAAVKASVTLVENHKMGGDCLNYGCVPSKALIRSAKLAHQMRRAGGYGLGDMQPAVHFRTVMRRVADVVRTIEPHDSVERFRALGVDVVPGHARIVDPWTVEISGSDGSSRRLTTRSIVIAAGARPIVPALPGLEDVGYVTSDTLWETFSGLDEVPRRLLVLGGGPIGCELAQAFARLGAKATVVETSAALLAREDAEVSAFAHEALESDGVRVLVGHRALRCERAGGEKMLVAEGGGREVRVTFDVLLCAVGRQARLEGYGLEELGIPTRRTIETNEYLQTLYPNILAAGDVAGPLQF
ncbi:MAG TPA: FAD-dependent oxidoreductase, partial [Ramlibacter sp.]